MRDFRAAAIAAIVSGLLLPVDGFCLSDAERLAGYDEDLRHWQVTAGAGTGALYGGAFGAGVEFGYKEISLFGSLGMDIATEHSALTDGYFDPTTAQTVANDVPEMETVWRVGVKGYLAGEELTFRPFLAGMFGPLMAYKINYNGVLHEGKYNSFGLAAGCDWDPGAKRGIVWTLGVSAFALTHSTPDDDVELVRFAYKSELPFIHARILAGLNYRY